MAGRRPPGRAPRWGSPPAPPWWCRSTPGRAGDAREARCRADRCGPPGGRVRGTLGEGGRRGRTRSRRRRDSSGVGAGGGGRGGRGRDRAWRGRGGFAGRDSWRRARGHRNCGLAASGRTGFARPRRALPVKDDQARVEQQVGVLLEELPPGARNGFRVPREVLVEGLDVGGVLAVEIGAAHRGQKASSFFRRGKVSPGANLPGGVQAVCSRS